MKQLMTSMFEIQTEGRNDKEIVLEGIDKLSAFWTSLGAPSRLADYNIRAGEAEEIAEIAVREMQYGDWKL